MKIFIAGYYGTGASAITDLLYEYDSIYLKNERIADYEHVIFKTPNGIFDLEDKLLNNNNLIRSDEAIKSFRKEMKRLNDYDFNWFGSYRSLFGTEFQKITDKFLNQIIQYEFYRDRGCWDWQCIGYNFDIIKCVKDIRRKLFNKRIFFGVGKIPRYAKENKIELSFVSDEEFFAAGKEFLEEYCQMLFGKNYRYAVLDQLLPVQQIDRISNYVDEDYKIILVERDLRDVYISNAEVYPTKTIVPLEIMEFIRYYKNVYKRVSTIDNPHVLKIQFEDLIYKYDDTVSKIENFIGLDPKSHIAKKKRFDPMISINNTQMFLKLLKYREKIGVIEKEMQEQLYDFPFEHAIDVNKVF